MVNWKEIERLARAHHQIDPTLNEKALWRRLKVWWCIKYNRPFKDPLIDSYTLDELVYEYLVHYYLDPENDPKKKEEEEKQKEDDSEWINQQLKPKAEKKTPEPKISPPPEISKNFEGE